MKFICKDFWNSVFKKQVDNLRTNHQVIINYNVLLQIVNILSIILWNIAHNLLICKTYIHVFQTFGRFLDLETTEFCINTNVQSYSLIFFNIKYFQVF